MGARVDRDEVFLELTRSICPLCKRVIDAEVNARENRVVLRKRCPEHGEFEALVSSDAEAYVAQQRFNKPGTIPLAFSTDVVRDCAGGIICAFICRRTTTRSPRSCMRCSIIASSTESAACGICGTPSS